MAAGSTYTPIATQTLGSAAASVTFSSIPSIYTDLVLVSFARSTIASTGNNLYCRVNGDSGTNYSTTEIVGDGSSAYSDEQINSNYGFIGFTSGGSAAAGVFGLSTSNFQNYANTTTYKTIISRGNAAGQGTHAIASIWRSTSALNQIVIYPAGVNNFATASTFTLYGIAAA